MEVNNLYLNQTKMVEGHRMRKKICEFIASSDCDALSTLSFIIQGKHRRKEEIENDLGSSVIESLINEIENSDHHKVLNVYEQLKEAEVL